MNKDIRDRYETRARIMKALGHPTRLFNEATESKQHLAGSIGDSGE